MLFIQSVCSSGCGYRYDNHLTHLHAAAPRDGCTPRGCDRIRNSLSHPVNCSVEMLPDCYFRRATTPAQVLRLLAPNAGKLQGACPYMYMYDGVRMV